MRRDIGVGTFCSWAPSTGAFEFRLMSTNKQNDDGRVLLCF